MIPDITYIVSCYAWPRQLVTLLASLAAQTHSNFEVLVTDNSTDRGAIAANRRAVKMFGARFRYYHTAPHIRVSDCYWSAEYGRVYARGQWLCFPCDDCYYPPEWAQRMLGAAYARNLDLVLCEYNVTGPEPCGADRYMWLKLGTPSMPGYKPSFLVRADKFKGWVNMPRVPACSGVDRTTLQYLVKTLRWGVVHDLFYVHN